MNKLSKKELLECLIDNNKAVYWNSIFIENFEDLIKKYTHRYQEKSSIENRITIREIERTIVDLKNEGLEYDILDLLRENGFVIKNVKPFIEDLKIFVVKMIDEYSIHPRIIEKFTHTQTYDCSEILLPYIKDDIIQKL